MKNRVLLLTIIFSFTTPLGLFSLPKTNVQDSLVYNEVSGKNTAVGRSQINRGIEAKGANIKDSVIANKSTGKVNAYFGSTVNTGIKANQANINNSVISVNSTGNINAVHSNVGTGINVSGARNSYLSSNVKGNINAVQSNVKVGTITGSANRQKITTNVGTNVNAVGRTVNLGTVHVDNGYGHSSYKDRHNDVRTVTTTNVGNVYVNGNRTKEVETTVGSGAGYGDRIKVRHKARVYADTGGVDASGTKYTYVTKAQRTKAENQQYGSVGNTYTSGQVRKVRTHVDQFQI